MSWEFKAGMKVVCVFAGRFDGQEKCVWLDGESVVEGRTYTVGSVFTAPKTGILCLTLQEVSRHPGAIKMGATGYGARRFRPVRTTDISALQAHLQTIPSRKTVEA